MRAHPNGLRALTALALVASIAAAGCRPDEQDVDPNAAVTLGDGVLAVDPADDVVYVARETTKDLTKFLGLFRLDHATGELSFFADLSDMSGARLAVTDAGVLVGGYDMRSYDRSGNLIASATAGQSMHEVTTSPSRKHALSRMADGSFALVDPASLEMHPLAATSGKVGHAFWGKKRDAVFATYFADSAPESPSARFLGWEVADLVAGGFAVDEATGLWAAPFVDVEIAAAPREVTYEEAPAISASDDLAAFPARVLDENGMLVDAAVLVDVTTGSASTFINHYGPYQFTADGSWLVTMVLLSDYTIRGIHTVDGTTRDISTFEREDGYHVSHVGDDVLFNNEPAYAGLHYDFTSDMVTGGTQKGQQYLFGFVMRFPDEPLLYDVDYTIEEKKGDLDRISFETGQITTFELAFKPQSAAGMPNGKRIVASDQDSPLVRVLSAETGEVEAEYSIQLN